MPDLVPRNLLGFGRDALSAFPVAVVQGARQVGKSTFAGMLLAGRPAREFTLDDSQTADAARNDPQGFIEQFPGHTVLIDELQRQPELLLAIKASVDRDRRPGRFILTGSSDLLRLDRTPDSLAGRAVTLRLHGFSQGELTGTTDDFVTTFLDGWSPAGASTIWTRDGYADAVAVGGYPELRRIPPRIRRSWIDSYLERIIQRDVQDVLAMTRPERLRSVLTPIASNQAGELVKARLATHAGLPATSITSYLDVLQTMYLIELVPPWTPNLTRREIGRAKAIVADSAMATRLAGLTSGQLAALTGADHLGGLLEGFVVSELLKQQTWSATDYRLFHYRDRNGLEVDIVLELEDGSIIGIEVKSSRTVKGEHFSGLRALQDKVGARFRGGFVVAMATSGLQHGPGLWGIPIDSLWTAGSQQPRPE